VARRGKYLIADLRDMLERPGSVLGVALVAVSALMLLVGLAGAVLVGPSSTWHANKTVHPNAPAIVVTSGVVGAIGPHLTLDARRADGGELFVGRAISSDVRDLTGTAPRLVVSGVHPLHRLSATAQAGSTSLGDVQTSDVWRETSVGNGSRTLDWQPDEESQSILIASTDGSALPAVKISVAWHRSGWFPGALLLVLLGLLVFAFGFHNLTGGRLLPRLLDRVFALLSRIPMPARKARGAA
jgi:hypothetical protein